MNACANHSVCKHMMVSFLWLDNISRKCTSATVAGGIGLVGWPQFVPLLCEKGGLAMIMQ